MIRKPFTIGIVSLGLVSSIVGCSPGGAKTSSSGTADTVGSDKKYTVSYFDFTWGEVPPSDGEGLKQIDQKFNIDFKPSFIPYDEYQDKLPVKIASGDIPDIIGFEWADQIFYKYAKEGAFLPLDSYFDQYPTLKIVPKFVRDDVTVNGKIFAIPRYFPVKYGKSPVIRKDWLDKLGLKMPTNYKELEEVAIAFVKNDMDGKGKHDTIGLVQYKGGAWPYDMGAYWSPTAWYQKNSDGQLIPGYISNANKERLQFFADCYQAGAMDKDFATMSAGDAKKEFYNGRAGIMMEQPYDIDDSNFQTLKKIDPNAQLAPIPPFQAPDGSQGFAGQPGYYQLFALSAKMKNEPGKVKRILDMTDYFRTFIPVDQRNSNNKDYDWQYGGVGKGYVMINDKPHGIDGAPKGLQPVDYYESRYWAPNDEANEVTKQATDPMEIAMVSAMESMHKQYKEFINPVNRIKSDVYFSKWSGLEQKLMDDETKMIVNNAVSTDFNKMVQDFLNKGGKEIIDDVNKQLKTTGVQGEWIQ